MVPEKDQGNHRILNLKKSYSISPADLVHKPAMVVSEIVSRRNDTWPSTNKKLPPAVWKL